MVLRAGGCGSALTLSWPAPRNGTGLNLGIAGTAKVESPGRPEGPPPAARAPLPVEGLRTCVGRAGLVGADIGPELIRKSNLDGGLTGEAPPCADANPGRLPTELRPLPSGVADVGLERILTESGSMGPELKLTPSLRTGRGVVLPAESSGIADGGLERILTESGSMGPELKLTPSLGAERGVVLAGTGTACSRRVFTCRVNAESEGSAGSTKLLFPVIPSRVVGAGEGAGVPVVLSDTKSRLESPTVMRESRRQLLSCRDIAHGLKRLR